MGLEEKEAEDNVKNVGLKVSKTSTDSEDEVDIEESIASIIRQFSKILKERNQHRYSGQGVSTPRQKFLDERKENVDENSSRIQCYECEGFGHVQSKCINTLKKKKKSVAHIAILSNNEESMKKLEEGDKTFLAFSGTAQGVATPVQKTATKNFFANDEELSNEDIGEACKLMLEKWIEVAERNKKLRSKIVSLKEEKAILENQVEDLDVMLKRSKEENESKMKEALSESMISGKEKGGIKGNETIEPSVVTPPMNKSLDKWMNNKRFQLMRAELGHCSL